MFIKVPGADGPNGVRFGDFIAEVRPPLHYDLVAAPLRPGAQWEEIRRENADGTIGTSERHLVAGGVDFRDAMGIETDVLHILGFAVDEVEYEYNKGLIALRYAWWRTERGVEGVVTTSPIFIMSDVGKTIDRV